MSNKGIETTLCLNTANRDTCIYPEPNDFVLDLNDRVEVQMAVLGSLEMPFNQWTVEHLWNRFFYTCGITFSSLADRTQVLCRERTPGQMEYTKVVLPQAFLTVAWEGGGEWALPAVGGLEKMDHGLVSANLPLLLPEILYFETLPGAGECAAPLRLPVKAVDPTSFKLITETPEQVSGRYGCLVCTCCATRTFRGLGQLAEVLTATFRAREVPFEFIHQCTNTHLELRVPAEQWWGVLCSPGSGLAPGSNLFATLGFPCPPPLPPKSCKPRPPCLAPAVPPVERPCSQSEYWREPWILHPPAHVQATAPYWLPESLTSSSWINRATPIEVPCGNYPDVNLFSRMLEMRLNSGSVASSMAKEAVFPLWVWGTRDPFRITVPPATFFYPTPFAEHVTTALTAGLAALPGYVVSVSYNSREDSFTLACNDTSRPFRISFGETGGDLSTRLGLENEIPLTVSVTGVKRRYFSNPQNLSVLNSYRHTHTQMTKTFVFSAVPKVQGTGPLPRCPVSVLLTPGGAAGVPLGSFPSEYCCWGMDSSMGLVHWYQVGRQDPTTGTAHLLPLVGGSSFIPEAVVLVPSLRSGFTFYFEPGQCWSRLADIMGVRTGTNESNDSGVLLAPRMYNFDAPSYILLQLGMQHMSANVVHRCRNDVKTQLFGKVCLYPGFKLERGYPIQKTATGVSVLSNLHIMVLNPWHEPYQFHGRDWSFTLVTAASGKPGITECV